MDYFLELIGVKNKYGEIKNCFSSNDTKNSINEEQDLVNNIENMSYRNLVTIHYYKNFNNIEPVIEYIPDNVELTEHNTDISIINTKELNSVTPQEEVIYLNSTEQIYNCGGKLCIIIKNINIKLYNDGCIVIYSTKHNFKFPINYNVNLTYLKDYSYIGIDKGSKKIILGIKNTGTHKYLDEVYVYI
tara:strand:+ start:1200 stop:1763 length:564 start_codon:yes stop_codon:yes gene_type:complete